MKKRPINNDNLKQLTDILLDSESWAELDMKFAICGFTMSADMIIVLCHFAFMTFTDAFLKVAYMNCKLSEEEMTKLIKNSQTILADIANDESIEINDDSIDMIIKKVIFMNRRKMIFQMDQEIVKKLVISLARRNKEFTKSCIDKYRQLLKYRAN